MKQKSHNIRIIGAPSDFGANMRGANIGPAAIRIAQLREKIATLGHRVLDAGDCQVPLRETVNQEAIDQKFLPTLLKICAELESKVFQALSEDNMPVVIGGDHSIAVATISAVSRFYKQQNRKIGLIWIDAHADLNTPSSSPTGNLHGMPLSAILGHGFPDLVNLGGFSGKVRPENVALVGIRDLDKQEKEICKQSGIRFFTMRDIDERGMFAVMNDALAIATKETEGFHLSFDMDAVDPLWAPGVSTPVPGGLSYREAHLALEMIADTRKLISLEFVELNPINDLANKTADLTIELIQSALGKAIL